MVIKKVVTKIEFFIVVYFWNYSIRYESS